MGSAYVTHEEALKGSIEAGKLADLAVWSQDPYFVSMREMWRTPIDLTLLGGEIVYQRT
jgi:predicted amidohydrolase YtcJ